MPGWARRPTASVGVWVARIKTMEIWIQPLCKVFADANNERSRGGLDDRLQFSQSRPSAFLQRYRSQGRGIERCLYRSWALTQRVTVHSLLFHSAHRV